MQKSGYKMVGTDPQPETDDQKKNKEYIRQHVKEFIEMENSEVFKWYQKRLNETADKYKNMLLLADDIEKVKVLQGTYAGIKYTTELSKAIFKEVAKITGKEEEDNA